MVLALLAAIPPAASAPLTIAIDPHSLDGPCCLDAIDLPAGPDDPASTNEQGTEKAEETRDETGRTVEGFQGGLPSPELPELAPAEGEEEPWRDPLSEPDAEAVADGARGNASDDAPWEVSADPEPAPDGEAPRPVEAASDGGGPRPVPAPRRGTTEQRVDAAGWELLFAGGLAAAWVAAQPGLLVRIWWWLSGLPLFSRRPGRALDHPVRRRVHEALRLHPGIVFSDLARQTGLRPGHLEYHLRVLARDGLAFKVRSRGFARYFADAGEARRLEQAAEPLRCPRAQRILQLVREGGAPSTRALAEATGLSPEAVRYHLRRLVKASLVASAALGRGPRAPADG